MKRSCLGTVTMLCQPLRTAHPLRPTLATSLPRRYFTEESSTSRSGVSESVGSPSSKARKANGQRRMRLRRKMSEVAPMAEARWSYMKVQKHENWHTKRLFENIRGRLIFDNLEYMRAIPAKRGGRQHLSGRLKGPIVNHFYDDNDDRVIYSMTRKRKAQMQAISPFEQQTLFTYRRPKAQYWKLKSQIQTGKKRLASKIHNDSPGHPEWRPLYDYAEKVTPKVSGVRDEINGSS